MAKRAPAGQGSIYQHKASGRWCAELYLGVEQGTGKRLVWRQWAARQGDLVQPLAEAIKDKAKKAREAARPKTERRQTVAEFLTEWLAAIEGSVAPRTHAAYALNNRRVIPHLGKILLAELDGAAVQRCYAALLKSGLNKKPLSRQTVNSVHVVLNGALEYARLKLHRIDANPCRDVVAPRAIKRAVVVLDVNHVRTLFAHTADHRLGPLWRVLITTGLRRGEVCGLLWSDVDLAHRTITIRQQIQRQSGKSLVVREPKTARSRRVIPLSDVALSALLDQQRRQIARGHGGGLVFTNMQGRALEPIGVTTQLQKALVASGVHEKLLPQLQASGRPCVNLHALRHTFASLLLREGVNPKEVQADLGHSSIATTMDVYSHFLPGVRTVTATAMDEALSEKLPVTGYRNEDVAS